jgi:hypothetical protein
MKDGWEVLGTAVVSYTVNNEVLHLKVEELWPRWLCRYGGLCRRWPPNNDATVAECHEFIVPFDGGRNDLLV